MWTRAHRKRGSAHDHDRLPHEEVRRLHRRRRRHLHRRGRPGDRVPRPQRRGQVHDHARHGRADSPDVWQRTDLRATVLRPAQPRPRGRRPARRLGPARRPHRTGDPHHRRPHDGPAPAARRGDARPGQPHREGGRPPGAQLLPRHAPAARHRARPDRRPVGADPRRAGQRSRPGGHPLDARPAACRTPTRAAPCCSPRTCCTRSRSSPTTSW